MFGYRYADRHLRHGAFVIEPENRRLTFASKGFCRSIEIDEVNADVLLRAKGHTVSHASANECQMRIAVLGFDDFLSIRQLRPQIHLIVAVFGAIGEQRAKGTEELRKQVIAILHST